MPRLFCLNSIVKNESARIVRMLDSVRPYIGAAVIVDTGSTDNTKAVIQKWCDDNKIKCWLYDAPFINWAQARNAALRAGRMTYPLHDCEYLLLVDADMELKVADPAAFDAVRGDAYDVFQKQGDLTYLNRRIVSVHSTGEYKGVTHEYLDVDGYGQIPLDKVWFDDHADGANRPNKMARDIKLLKQGLKDEPDNARYFFYLAQSYNHSGDYARAIRWYERRVKAGGWDEEAWYAQYQLALCQKALGREKDFVWEMNRAHAMRPWRAEPLYQLALFYREQKDMQALGALYAEEAMKLPPHNDVLFVENYAHDTGPKNEFGICGFYILRKRDAAFRALDAIALDGRPEIAGAREGARTNLNHFLPTLKDVCPSFDWQPLRQITTYPGYVPMNPSVANDDSGSLSCIIRNVNYRMDDDGRYLINGTDGTANGTNPISTLNVLARLGPDLQPCHEQDLPAGKLPVEYPLVIGFEDSRLFYLNRELYTSSTVRQLNKDGWCEQVLTKRGPDAMEIIARMPRIQSTEKNWMPITHDGMWLGDFMYRLNARIKPDGRLIKLFDTRLDVNGISGGSQVIHAGDGWVAIVHEARPRLDKPWKRYYWHRVVFWAHDFKHMRISRPFVFNDKTIEFCAGLAKHPDGERFVISYGFEDREPRIATVTMHELLALLEDVPC